MRIREKLAWITATALGLFVVASIATEVAGGPLDPPGTPSSTMRTLNEVLPSWHSSLSTQGACQSERWDCVIKGNAVLDRETGLVWQQDSLVNADELNWYDSLAICRTLNLEGKLGWRVPTIEEFFTLLDNFSQPPDPPFTAGVNPRYWTASTDPANAANALYWSFTAGSIFPGAKSGVPATGIGVWCVRGPGGIDGM
jgi:hypothetical protein